MPIKITYLLEEKRKGEVEVTSTVNHKGDVTLMENEWAKRLVQGLDNQMTFCSDISTDKAVEN